MNSGLDNKKEKAASHLKPTKGQVRTELHYYLVTFFWLVDDFDSMKKKKSDFFALIGSVLHIKKQLYR
ncbi:hypothetical protein ACIXNO_04790 [Bacteroides fragilis]